MRPSFFISRQYANIGRQFATFARTDGTAIPMVISHSKAYSSKQTWKKKIIGPGVLFRRSLPNTMINIGISHDRRHILPNCLNPFLVFGKRPESLRIQLGTPNPSPFFWTLLDQWIATGALRRFSHRWAPLGPARLFFDDVFCDSDLLGIQRNTHF